MVAWTPARKYPVIALFDPTEHVHVLRFEPQQWRLAIRVLVHWHADLELIDLAAAEHLADEVERIGRRWEQTQEGQGGNGVLDKIAQIGREMFTKFLKGQ